MKKILLFGFLLCTLAASAQTHPGYAPKVFAYGNDFNRAAFDSALHIPNKPCLCLLDNDTTPQLFVFADSLRAFFNGNYYNFGHSGGGTGGGTYTGDGSSISINGSNVISVKPTWTGQTTITTVGAIGNGTWQSTPIADPYIASAVTWNAKLSSALPSAQILVGNGSGIATPVTPTGDVLINNAGVTSLRNIVTAGNCTACNITYDANGRITVAANGTPGSAPFPDNAAIIKNNADNTRLLILSAAAIATGTTRTWTFPNTNGIVARNDGAQTFLGTQTFASAPNLTGASTTGYVWTALDNAGNGAWAAGGSGGGLNQLTGDGTAGPGTGSQVFTLATVNGTVGTFGDGVRIPSITVNGKGLITNVTTNYIDSSKFSTRNYVDNLTATIGLRNPGTGANAIVTAFTNAGNIVIPKWQPGWGVAPFSVASDSLITIIIDSSSATGVASKAYVNARVGGGTATPGGASGDGQWNSAGTLAGGAWTWDNTNSIISISKTQNNELGYYAQNFSTGAAGGVTYTATNGSQTTKFGQYGSGNSFGMVPASAGFINSNATNFSIYNYNNSGSINFGVGASITLPTVTLTLSKLKIVPSILQTGTVADSILAYRVSDNAVYAIAQSSIGSLNAEQTQTSGTSVTVSNGNNILYVDPSSTLASDVITLPATAHISNRIIIHFGGTLTSGSIVTALSITGNTGQTIMDNTPPGSSTADDTLIYDYRPSTSTWIRVKL